MMTTTGARRGNSIILVVAILVLLVISAAAYITRTQGGRVTARAIQSINQRESRVNHIRDFLASDAVSGALFPAPLATTLDGSGNVLVVNPPDANEPRLSSLRNPVRYGIDHDVNGDGLPDHPWNFAPIWVFPFTNWPDNDPAYANLAVDVPALDLGNPLGYPGQGDTRWLRSTEPMRWATGHMPAVPDALDAYWYWRHMTNIARSDNGYRVVRDASDVIDSDGNNVGGVVLDLNIPHEQWLIGPHLDQFSTVTGDASLAVGVPGRGPLFQDSDGDGESDFIELWQQWLLGHSAIFTDPALVPPNFYRLSDLDADGVRGEDGERPEDEFRGPGSLNASGGTWPFGSPRYNVSRVLADTDGDGYTDSFWFLAPTPVDSGIRQLVAISITDNGAMLNANVATRLVRNDYGISVQSDHNFSVGSRTIGATPSDIALVGDNDSSTVLFPDPTWNVGYLDTLRNRENFMVFPPGGGYGTTFVGWEDNRWLDFRNEIGVTNNPFFSATAQLNSAFERRLYWLLGARQPLSPLGGLTPFGPSDELELRMYHGQNYPWVLSRLERGLNTIDPDNAFLRSPLTRREMSEHLEQLGNRELLNDHRKRMTVFSGARNDLLPPWLWPDAFTPQQKLDLRAPVIDPLSLREILTRALTYEDGTVIQSYLGDTGAAIDATEELAVAYAANILDWRDDDDEPTVLSTQTGPFGTASDVRYMGLEPQPFIVEAFVGHIYRGYEVPTTDAAGIAWVNAGDMVVFHVPTGGDDDCPSGQDCEDEDGWHGTAVAVQIANPFDTAIDLTDFRLEVFGRTVQLDGVLEPANEELFLNNVTGMAERRLPTLIVWAVSDRPQPDAVGDVGEGSPAVAWYAKWQDSLDLSVAAGSSPNLNVWQTADGTGDLPSGTRVLFTDVLETGQRSLYDEAEASGPDCNGNGILDADEIADDPTLDTNGNGQIDACEDVEAVVLRRSGIVVDRIDPPDDQLFLEAVQDLKDTRPPCLVDRLTDQTVCDPDDVFGDPLQPNLIHPGGTTHTLASGGGTDDYWIQWARATRAWGFNIDGDIYYEDHERAPRYVAGDRAIVSSSGTIASGSAFAYAVEPDTPWFTHGYQTPGGATATRKPTFLNLNVADSGVFGYPDKGWYGQGKDVTDPVRDSASGEIIARQVEPFQMLHKNRDFDRIGELLDVFLFGHRLVYDSGTYESTEITFSEFMSEENQSVAGYGLRANRLQIEPTDLDDDGDFDAGFLIGSFTQQELQAAAADPNGPAGVAFRTSPRHAMPALPAALRLLDGVVCDGYGQNTMHELDGIAGINALDAELRRYDNANRFEGRMTPGLINLATAPVEVMRALPHWDRLIHEESRISETLWPPQNNPYTLVGDALVRYRQKQGDPQNLIDAGPAYADRGANVAYVNSLGNDQRGFMPGLRAEPGLASPHEILLLNRGGKLGKVVGVDPVDGTQERLAYAVPGTLQEAATRRGQILANSAWRIGHPALPERRLFFEQHDSPFATPPTAAVFESDLFEYRFPANSNPPQYRAVGSFVASASADPFDPRWTATSAALSTDVNGRYIQNATNPAVGTIVPDAVGGDAEESSLLHSGASNLITTRSDVFTVYFRVRSFRQDPDTLRWNALDRENIIDDSRYVMVVDRSQVNTPQDEPRILFFEKVP